MSSRLDEAEVKRLFAERSSDEGTKARNLLVENYRGLAIYFAKKYQNRGVSSEDLEQVAMVGLISAVDRYDPAVGVKFSTFCGRTVNGELKRYFRDKTWSVRVPRRTQELSADIRKATDYLTETHKQTPTVQQIADHLAIDTDTVIEAMDAAQSYTAHSIDQPTTDGTEPIIRGGTLAQKDEGFEQTESALLTAELLDSLPGQTRRLLELRFFERKSQTEIAKILDISQVHVGRLIKKTLLELRTVMQ